MQKKTKYQIVTAILGAIIIGFFSLLYFAGYGGSNCDMPGKDCSCFCCNMFGIRGYESCGDFGLILGGIIGALLGILIIHLIWMKYFNKK